MVDDTAEAELEASRAFVTERRNRPSSANVLKSAGPKQPPPTKTWSSASKGLSFPTRQRSDSSSSSDMGSPVKRPRAQGTMGPPPRPVSPVPVMPRMPFRTTSSATLFFGGSAIPQEDPDFGLDSICDTYHPNNSARNPAITVHPQEDSPWKASPSARYSSPPRPPEDDDFDYEEELSFEGANSSFALSIFSGSPSPKKANEPTLPKKFKPRDSGVSLSDDENPRGFLHVPPVPSSSSGSIHSSGDEALVTPVFPSHGSGWPGVQANVGVATAENAYEEVDSGIDVDTFILRTLAAGAKEDPTTKKAPGTPVKKVKTSHFTGHERPWQSAFTHKIGDVEFDELGLQEKGKPRKSMPAAFSGFGAPKKGKREVEEHSSDEEVDESPTLGREAKYEGLGLGRPVVKGGVPPFKPGWLMRRSSSGAFSSGSDTSGTFGTPTRLRVKDTLLAPSRIRTQFSPAIHAGLSSASTTSSGQSSASLNSPTVARFGFGRPDAIGEQAPRRRRRTRSNLGGKIPVNSPFNLNVGSAGHGQKPVGVRQTHKHQRERSAPGPLYRSEDDQPGRYERDFVEIEEIGRGEFGRVVKVKPRQASTKEVYAIKISKRFEGARRRARVREEADILKHLSLAANGRHPNVLAYIDSWEEDEALYIQTEICEHGSFSHFLWEYGRVFPRLEEARVWKIVAELSNGLRFIHDHGVIHLDLKPANILVTAEGRFKIGDFGMASIWPRPPNELEGGTFEREGDKLYLAPEVLQGRYGKAADIFSLGMTLLETASNILVPDQGESWHKLRQEDFRQVDMEDSPELFSLIKAMMRTDPVLRLTIGEVWAYPIVMRARRAMERMDAEARRTGRDLFSASPLAPVPEGFLEEILQRRVLIGDRDDDDDMAMDISA
ncbi:kinase-like protein [Gloeophyllum trabeum ATCC 11539]|uniref:Kinase-like protein n=1 Tax=Gloeophyllum trabeum (strain ATCC 11539 / FP-39264 / Madison 617) TaxID=670483 RepID=S7QDB4_GLOTA|nr:kinase-like protein [Gloeophyllum trabeum ATCC 11539]EPQ57327.1 kinase-like protein [Gloeophyllum trabeum ATCC 11539]